MCRRAGRIQAFFASVAVLLSQSGCAAIERSSIDRLPPELRDRVGLEPREDGSRRLVVIQRLRVERDGTGPASLSFPLSPLGSRWYTTALIPAVVTESGAGRRHEADFLLDTGGDFIVLLDAPGARRLGVWISAEADSSESLDVLGSTRTYHGLLAELRLGPLALAPVSVSVSDAGRRGSPLLGAGFVEQCLRGVVIDPRAGVCTLLLPAGVGGQAPDVPPGWVSVPWVSRDGRGMRTIPVRVGDREYRAVLDTASPAGVFTFVDLLVEGRAVEGSVSAAGRRGRAVTRALVEPLHVGPLTLRGVPVTRAIRPDNAQRSPDLVIGVATLGDVPVWFDPGAGEVRLWMREGPARLPSSRDPGPPG